MNQAFAIANIWIQAGSAVMGAWSGAFTSVVFPPAAAIMAGIMSGLITTMAGVQTGIVASQAFHAPEGGVIQSGTPSGDRSVLFANKGEAVLQSSDFQLLVDQIRRGSVGGGGGIIGSVVNDA